MESTKNKVSYIPDGETKKSFVKALQGTSIFSKGAVRSSMTTYMSSFFQEDVHVKKGIQIIESFSEIHNQMESK